MDNKNYSKVSELAAKHLGQVGGAGYKDSYDPSLLVKIPRHLNREGYGIEESSLPFVGYDVWNAYEVSALSSNNLPVTGMLKIVCPADSEFHVESKSIKLYLNSLNMSVMGSNSSDVVTNIERTVSEDLSNLLESDVKAYMFRNNVASSEGSFTGYPDISTYVDLDSLTFEFDTLDASGLSYDRFDQEEHRVAFSSDLLRSNCRVTNQPDWGDVFIMMDTNIIPSYSSIAKYIVSHRKVNHFHEEIVEMLFTHFMEAYRPRRLMVTALYTRRGGIDINPLRATHEEMIPGWFTHPEVRLRKTLRQ